MAIRTLDNIQAQLEKTTGLILSQDWLSSCRTHLQNVSQETVDAVLCQVLHADLRDVVRPLNHHSVVETTSVELPHLLLRKAVTESLDGEARKAILPSTFRLLVQVEELFDISLDAESRFSKRSTNQSIQNRKTRCLKVYLSDGHLPSFDLIGMEVSPIPNLSVNSTAGTKVLIRGPLEIRLGILQWNPSNAVVLGGCVSELIPIQRKAMEQAQRMAGVDPTVRALIGNDPVGELEQQDEGEAASSDVVNHTRPQQNVALSRVVPQIPQSEPPIEQQRQQSYTDRPQTRTLSSEESKTKLVEAPRANPYARKTGSSTRQATSINSSKIVNLYEDENESPSKNTNSLIIEKRTENIPALETSPQRSIALTHPPEPVSFEQLVDLLRQFPSNRCEDKVYVVPAKMKGRHLYFNIDKKTKNKSRSDNKRKSTGGNKDDKYEYVMKIHLSGSGTSQLVTAVVSDLILRPHFQLKPGQMRKLSREDRATSEKLVQKGGESVTAALTVLNAWEVSILKSGTPPQPIDGEEPVLRITQLSDLGT